MVDKKDVFLCHTSDDKKKYVYPFIKELEKEGISYWIDEAEIKWGKNIVNKINEGLTISRFVVVFLSSKFIGQKWPKEELASALYMENAYGKVIVLPILIGDENDIFKQYPLLQHKKHVKWSDDISSIVSELKSVLSNIDNSETKLKKADEGKLSRSRPSEKDLLGELQAYSGMLPFLETQTLQQQLILSLHNHFSRILLAKYNIIIKEKERSNSLHILIDKMNKLSLPNLVPEDESFNKEFSDALKVINKPVSEIQNLLESINVLTKPGKHSDESTKKMSKQLHDFYLLCYQLFALGQSPKKAQIRKILAMGGESDKIEYKSTLTWDLKEKKKSKEMKRAIAKTVAAFMNSRGGTLLIGVDDDGNPIGLDNDFNFLDKEGFVRTFAQTVSDFIGGEYDQFIQESDFLSVEGKDIFYVTVDKSFEPAFVKHEGKIYFHIRVRNTSPPLNVEEAINYYKMHWVSKKGDNDKEKPGK